MNWIDIKNKKPKSGEEVMVWTIYQDGSNKNSRFQRATYYELDNGDSMFSVYPLVWNEKYKSTSNFVGSDLEGDSVQITHWSYVKAPESVINDGLEQDL